jgi:hypothetical protein
MPNNNREYTLAVQPLSGGNNAFRLGLKRKDAREIMINSNKLEDVFVKFSPKANPISLKNSLGTYLNWGGLLNAEITHWIYSKGLNEYDKGYPHKLRFKFENKGKVHEYTFIAIEKN